jgi:threonine/homoserine/homoserine lactone efflux protein
MDTALMAQFWLVALTLAVTPGADWAYAIAAGLRARSVVPSIAGMVTGYALVVTLVAVGAGAAVTAYPAVLTALTLAGSAYLVYLGLGTLFARAPEITDGGQSPASGALAQFLRGAGVSGINPKGILLLLALLPQFTSEAGAWSSTAQMFALGSLHVVNCAVIYPIVALAAKQLLRSRPRARGVVTKVSGLLMTAIGTGILVEQVAAFA